MTTTWTKISAPTPNVNITIPSVVGTPIGLLLALTRNIPQSSIVTTIWTTVATPGAKSWTKISAPGAKVWTTIPKAT